MRIILAPNQTGSGHNMRTLALAREIRQICPEAELIVLLASLQDIFSPLFRECGTSVIDIAEHPVDHTSRDHLDKRMDWDTYIGGYIASSFVNGARLLKYIALYENLEPDLVVSDYNIAASMAAIINGTAHALVTERYDFTICQVDDDTLEASGFTVSREDMKQSRKSLHRMFEWIVSSAEAVLTDKPAVKELDSGTAVWEAMSHGTVHFPGPMIRDIPVRTSAKVVRDTLRLGSGPIIVASVGGTTMFLENKERAIKLYIDAYKRLKMEHQSIQLVLLSRGQIEAPNGVVVVPYLPDWMPLLREADALMASPGWITVTEVAALKVPTVFVLSGAGEYHELEAAKRLHMLGFPVLIAPDGDQLAESIRPLIGRKGDYEIPAQTAVAPNGAGTRKAASILVGIAQNIVRRAGLPAIERMPHVFRDGAARLRTAAAREAARLLLWSDGSTTRMLESLIGCELVVKVESQEYVKPEWLAPMVVEALGVCEEDKLVERRSTLRDRNDSVLSKNVVVFAGPDIDYVLATLGNGIPLGRWLRESHVMQFREILAVGTAAWSDGSPDLTCAFKEYVITCNSGVRLYVLEKFNPAYINPSVLGSIGRMEGPIGNEDFVGNSTVSGSLEVVGKRQWEDRAC
jgi:chorismate-pyruvate lyase